MAPDFVAPSRFVLTSPNFLDGEYLGPYLLRFECGIVNRSMPTARDLRASVTNSAFAIVLVIGILTGGCGDGIGRPIRAEGSSVGGTGGVGTGLSNNAGVVGSIGGSSVVASTGPAGGTGFAGPLGPPVPIEASMAYCSATQNWPVEQAAAEDALLGVLNRLRLSGQVTCASGSSGVVGPPLVMSEQLRCSARVHSLIMAQNGILTSFLGDPAVTRIALAGYSANQNAEVITTSDPANVDVAALLDRLVTGAGTDCANLLDPSFTSVGIGFATDPAQGYWTIDLTSP
jgi:uncharacterized protein YkwD